MTLHRAIILTTDKKTLSWLSLPAKQKEILDTLNSMKNADFSLDIEAVDYVPEVKDGKILDSSYNALSHAYLAQGYDFVLLHMNGKQRLAAGIQVGLRGNAWWNDGDEVAEAFFWANENTKRIGYSQFVQTCLHEISHLFCANSKRLDETHAYHDEHKDIKGLFLKYDMALYDIDRMALKKEKNRLESIVATLRALWAQKTETGTKPHVINALQPIVQRQADKFVKEMALMGLPIRITEGFRSNERQNQLYAQGRTTPGAIVTKAKGGESMHNYGVAVDIVFRKQGYEATYAQWTAAATIAKTLGFEWGGSWKAFIDKPHFEMTHGYSLSDFQKGKVDYKKFN